MYKFYQLFSKQNMKNQKKANDKKCGIVLIRFRFDLKEIQH